MSAIKNSIVRVKAVVNWRMHLSLWLVLMVTQNTNYIGMVKA